jgi:hypothetical protein
MARVTVDADNIRTWPSTPLPTLHADVVEQARKLGLLAEVRRVTDREVEHGCPYPAGRPVVWIISVGTPGFPVNSVDELFQALGYHGEVR